MEVGADISVYEEGKEPIPKKFGGQPFTSLGEYHEDLINDSLVAVSIPLPDEIKKLVRSKIISSPIDHNKILSTLPRNSIGQQIILQAIMRLENVDSSPIFTPGICPSFCEVCFHYQIRNLGKTMSIYLIPYRLNFIHYSEHPQLNQIFETSKRDGKLLLTDWCKSMIDSELQNPKTSEINKWYLKQIEWVGHIYRVDSNVELFQNHPTRLEQKVKFQLDPNTTLSKNLKLSIFLPPREASVKGAPIFGSSGGDLAFSKEKMPTLSLQKVIRYQFKFNLQISKLMNTVWLLLKFLSKVRSKFHFAS